VTRQEGQEHEGGMEDSGISPREFSGGLQTGEAAIPEGGCDFCGHPVDRRRRGRPPKFHPACRRAFDRQARRVGARALRRQLARARHAAIERPRIPRPRLTARAKRLLAFLVAAGSVLSGIPIPPQTSSLLAPRGRRQRQAAEGAP
jgi:hypothetical protein